MANAIATLRNSFARGAATTFRYPLYGSLTGGLGGNAATWNDWLTNRLLPGSDYDYVAEAGDLWKNTVVSAALAFAMRTFPEPELIVKRTVPDDDSEDPNGVRDLEVRQHPLLDLINEPNEDDDDATSVAQMYALDYNAWGRHYWLLLRNTAGRVVGFQPIPQRMMQPAGDPSGVRRVAAYIYFRDGQRVPYDPRDVVHFRFGRDPNNIRNGFQPLEGACRDICTENELATLAAAVARNHGVVPYVVSPMATDVDAVMPRDQKDQLQEEFDGRTRDRRGKTMVLRRAFRVDRIGLSPDEMMSDKARAIAVSRILGPLGIDAMVLGLPSETRTFNNMGEAMTGAYEHNIIPTGDAYATRITQTFRREPGYLAPNERLAWDYSGVTALRDQRAVLMKIWGDFYKVGACTRLEAKMRCGLPYNKVRDNVYVQEITPVRGAAGDILETEEADGIEQAQKPTGSQISKMIADWGGNGRH